MVNIAVVQLTSGINPNDMADIVSARIKDAAQKGAKVVFTPECTNMMNIDRAELYRRACVAHEDPCYRAAQEAARANNVTVVVGSLLVRAPSEGKMLNQSVVFDPTGKNIAHYNKIHLFDVDLSTGETHRESHSIEHGDQAVVIPSAVGVLGLSICYDLRFAKLYNIMAQHGAEVFSIPAAFTIPTGTDHWHVLQRARAIENGCYVVAAAQVGSHEGLRETYGHSLVVDPWGKVIADAGDKQDVTVIVDINTEACVRARTQVPALLHGKAIRAPATIPHKTLHQSVTNDSQAHTE